MADACIVHLKDVGVKRKAPAKGAQAQITPAKTEPMRSTNR
jgi:hypothetical protein